MPSEHDIARAQESAEWTQKLRASGQLKPDEAVWIDAQDEPHITKAHKLPDWAWPIIILGGALGGSAIASAFGAGGGAAGSAASAPLVGSGTISGLTPAQIGMGMGLPAAGITGAAGFGGGAGAAAAGSAVAGAAEGAAKGLGSKLAEAAVKSLPAAAGLAGAAMAGKDEKSVSPEAQALLDEQLAKMQASTPLYESILRLAYGRLPVNARGGQGPLSYADAASQIPEVGEGNYTEDPASRRLMREQTIRSRMSAPMYDAILRLAQGRMPVNSR